MIKMENRGVEILRWINRQNTSQIQTLTRAVTTVNLSLLAILTFRQFRLTKTNKEIAEKDKNLTCLEVNFGKCQGE